MSDSDNQEIRVTVAELRKDMGHCIDELVEIKASIKEVGRPASLPKLVAVACSVSVAVVMAFNGWMNQNLGRVNDKVNDLAGTSKEVAVEIKQLRSDRDKSEARMEERQKALDAVRQELSDLKVRTEKTKTSTEKETSFLWDIMKRNGLVPKEKE